MVSRSSEPEAFLPFRASLMLKRTITLSLWNPHQTVREVFPHTAFLNVHTVRQKPTDTIVIKQTQVSVDVLGAYLTPSVSAPSFSSPLDNIPIESGKTDTLFKPATVILKR